MKPNQPHFEQPIILSERTTPTNSAVVVLPGHADKLVARFPVLADTSAEIAALAREVEEILGVADKDQAALTERYLTAGRRLRAISARTPHGEFGPFLERAYPHRDRSTLFDGFDAASPEEKIQLTGLFKHGWGAVLHEIRWLKKLKRAQSARPIGSALNGDALKILHGDCLVCLRELPDESADCVITSVPYFHRLPFPVPPSLFGGRADCFHSWQTDKVAQREFGTGRRVTTDSDTCQHCGARRVQLGWEDSVEEYVSDIVTVCKEIKRVLKPTGLCWLNVSDKFSDGKLLLVPQRLFIALEAIGFLPTQEVIWEVPNRAPECATKRFYANHEYIFALAKTDNYYFDSAAVREPSAPARKDKQGRFNGVSTGIRRSKQSRFNRDHSYAGMAATCPVKPQVGADGKRNLRSVWPIPNEPYGSGHACAFPKALVERLLLSSCPVGGVCLDPFAGVGTVGLVALAHDRRSILIEANADYCAEADRKIRTELDQYKREIEKRRTAEHHDVSDAVH